MSHSGLRRFWLGVINRAIGKTPKSTAEQDALVEALVLHAATCVLAQAGAGYSGEVVQLMAEAALAAMDKVLASKDTN